MARKEESRVGGIGAASDTRQDTPFKGFTEAHSLDPGGERQNDTRQDPPSETEPTYLLGRWLGIGGDTRQDRHRPLIGFGEFHTSEERGDGVWDHASGQAALRGGATQSATDCRQVRDLPEGGFAHPWGGGEEDAPPGDDLQTL